MSKKKTYKTAPYKQRAEFIFNDSWETSVNRNVRVQRTGDDILFTGHFAVDKVSARRLAYYILEKTK